MAPTTARKSIAGASVPRQAAFVTLGAVFVLKLIVLLQLRDHPLTRPDAGLDTSAYVHLATQALDGNWSLGPGVYYVSPLYIYFLAAAGVAVVMLIVTRRIRPAALLAAGLVVGMAPASVRNIVVAGHWSPVSSHGGLNFSIGNRETATGFYLPVPGITPTIVGQEKDARRVAEQALGHPVTDAEASDDFFGLSRTWMTHPDDQLAKRIIRGGGS